MNNQNSGLENLDSNNENNLNNQMNIPQNNNFNNGMNIPQNNNFNMNIPINKTNNIINNPQDDNLGRPVFHPMNEYHPNEEPSKERKSFLKKLDYKKILIIGGIIVFIIVVVIIGKNIFKNKKSSSEDFLASNSFFLSNKNNSAIFDKNGKQLTDFIYQSGSDFINGSALVENPNDERGLVSESGKMLIEFGKCNYLLRYGSVFICTTSDHKHILYDSKGNVLLEDKNLDGFDAVGEYAYSVISNGKDMMVYNYNGDKVTSFPVDDSLSLFNNEPIIDGIDNYASINYDNKSYIIDNNSKLLFTLDEPYCISAVSEDKKQFIISSCLIGKFILAKISIHTYANFFGTRQKELYENII